MWGNQKWNGAAPIFINNEELIIILKKLLSSKILKNIIFINTINKKFTDEIDWTIKYFKHDSDNNKLLGLDIIVINLNKLISNPIQQPNHEFEEIVIIVLINKIK